MYVFQIVQEACRITKGIPYGRARNGITTGWCHYTRTVCLCYTSVSGRGIIHGYILSRQYFASFILSSTMEDNCEATNNCPKLQIPWPYTKEMQLHCATGFTSISTNHALWDCVAVLDGYHLQTITPFKKEVHNVWSYLIGHYQTYGVNIQAVCDQNCHFLFIGVTGPGVMGD